MSARDIIVLRNAVGELVAKNVEIENRDPKHDVVRWRGRLFARRDSVGLQYYETTPVPVLQAPEHIEVASAEPIELRRADGAQLGGAAFALPRSTVVGADWLELLVHAGAVFYRPSRRFMRWLEAEPIDVEGGEEPSPAEPEFGAPFFDVTIRDACRDGGDVEAIGAAIAQATDALVASLAGFAPGTGAEWRVSVSLKRPPETLE